ncbi:hypothetical protein BT96DRAFT_1025174 [Gymnopus androsaceus JB14]|uniref:Uncharacterized protein n=1 Tax=Gymnopus androsaceus JB14 TaxID=1447944 RepID=A0A6A4GUK4_9AGAR|nr:hypothetical protein BT96DRAFT_1025174 [Gymnopus androsaceus JB14]
MRIVQHVFLAVTTSALFARALPVIDDSSTFLKRNLEERTVQPAFGVDLITKEWIKKREEDIPDPFDFAPQLGKWIRKRKEDIPDPTFAIDLITEEWIKKREDDVLSSPLESTQSQIQRYWIYDASAGNNFAIEFAFASTRNGMTGLRVRGDFGGTGPGGRTSGRDDSRKQNFGLIEFEQYVYRQAIQACLNFIVRAPFLNRYGSWQFVPESCAAELSAFFDKRCVSSWVQGSGNNSAIF